MRVTGSGGAVVFALGALATFACDGGAPGPLTHIDAGAGDGRPATADVRPDLHPPHPPHPPPDMRPPRPGFVNPSARRLLAGRALLLGTHQSACSHGPGSAPPGAGRWCAISKPGPTLGSQELWVLDVTEALALPAGQVQCNGSSPHCLRLTGTLFAAQPEAGPIWPTSHRFHGDTLIYYADARTSSTEIYRGPVYAWQPGWPAGRAIASERGLLCSGHARGHVATCIENISPEGTTPVTWDLHAGRVDGGPLRKVATIFPVHPGTEASQWASAFTASGDHFLFSTPPSPEGRETLFAVRTDPGDTAGVTALGEPGISRWTLSADGGKLFYLRDYNYNRRGEPSGTLYRRDFPAGTTETRIEGARVPGPAGGGVATYQLLTDASGKQAGLALLVGVSQGRGSFRLMKDPGGSADDPMNVVTLLENVSGLPGWSPDLRYFVYGPVVHRADGTVACQVSAVADLPIGPGFTFFPDSSLMIWSERFEPLTDSADGWVGSPEGCAGRRRFASGLDFWFVTERGGRRGLLYSDDSDGSRVSLRNAWVSSGELGTSGPLERQVDRMFAVLPDGEGVLYQIIHESDVIDGLYHVPLHLPSPPP